MEAIRKTSPYIRKDTNTSRMMVDVLIALSPVVIFSVYKFGGDALLRIIISVFTMVALEVLMIGFIRTNKEANTNKPLEGTYWNRFAQRYSNLRPINILAPAISGFIYAMLVPAQIEFFPLIVGAVFGILIGKMVFGGFGQNIFNPAALGRIFIGLSYNTSFIYPGVNTLSTGATPLGGEFNAMINEFSFVQLFTGDIPGSMGEICKIAILLGMAYLLFRKAADWRVMLSTFVSFAVMILFAGLAYDANNAFKYLGYHLLSGGLLFGAVYMVTDPVTSPVTAPGRMLYGTLIGLVTALIRIFGAYNEGMAFAIVICNMVVPLIDYYKWSSNKYTWKYAILLVVIFLGFIPLFYFGNGGAF